MKLFNLSSLILLVAACGGGKDPVTLVDSPTGIDAPVNPPPPPGCDYGELQDASNDDLTSMAGAAEATQVAFSNTAVLCGKIDNTHFEPDSMGGPGVVDADMFAMDLAADSDLLVTISGAGLEQLSDVLIVAADAQSIFKIGTFTGDHAVFAVSLPAGSYEFGVFADNAAAPGAAIDYKIKVTVDTPNTRCAPVTATADRTEQADGGNNAGNDMVEIRFNPPMGVEFQTLTLANDAPEPTGVTTAAGTHYRFSGTTANVDPNDEYKDRDTYLFATGADTNQLTIRLDWADGVSDHDVFLFNENAIGDLDSGAFVGDDGPEFFTVAVQPNSNYWVWTGTYDVRADNTTAPTLPSNYDISVCAEAFTP